MQPRLVLLALALAAPVRAQTPAVPAPAAPAPAAGGIAIRNVTIVDVSGGPERTEMTVVVRGTRIVTVDKTRHVPVSPGTRTIDGTGRFLIPGLWDMHVHSAANAERDLPLFLAFGVTGVRNMHSTVDTALALTNAVRRRVRAGTLVGPRFVANGPILDGPRPAQRGAVAIGDAEEASRVVDSLVRGGAEFIKVYNLLGRDAYKAVLQQAKNRRVPVVGHVPFEARAAEASVAGQRSMEHLDGLDFACSTREDSLRENLLANPSRELWHRTQEALVATWSAARCGPTIQAYKTNVTWQVPTLVTGWVLAAADSVLGDDEAMALVPRATRAAWRALADSMPAEQARYERDWFTRKLATVGLLHRAGVPILAGSDVGNPLLVPGYSLHQELELLVRAGLTPIEALRTATVIPARYFARGDELGTIVPGKLADLVLLDADPREDIANARRIRAVVANGRYLNRTALDAMLRRAASPTARGRE